MFHNFINEGSVLAVLLMTYAQNVGIEIAQIANSPESRKINAPRLVQGGLATLFMLFTLPMSFWSAFYIGSYDGLLAGFVSWIVIQVVGAILTIFLGIKGPAIAFHFLAAIPCGIAGYYLSYSTFP